MLICIGDGIRDSLLNADDDVEFKFFTNLSDAKHWIDKYNVPNNG